MQHRFPNIPAHDAIRILQSCFRAELEGGRKEKKDKEREKEISAVLQSPQYKAKRSVSAAAKSLPYEPITCRHLCPCSQPHHEMHRVGVTTLFSSYCQMGIEGRWDVKRLGIAAIETSLRFLDTAPATIIEENMRTKWLFHLFRD